jgi:hypothetical protein
MLSEQIGGPVVCPDCGQAYNCARDIHVCQRRKSQKCCPHEEGDHVLTAYRRYCTRCGCETKECHCKALGGLADSCPMHGGLRMTAHEQPPVRPADVVDDTISAMIATYREDESGKFKPVRDRMTAAYQVARAQVIAEALDAVSKIDIGKPIGAVNPIYEDGWAAGWNNASHWWREKIKELRARLAQADKPRTKQERVEAILLAQTWENMNTSKLAAEIIAELEKAQ